MNIARQLSTKNLTIGVVGVVAAASLGGAVARGALGGGTDKPAPKPLAAAVHDALAGDRPVGITARIRFTNRLLPTDAFAGGLSPLITGASGRLWVTNDGRLRLELQSAAGDAQVLVRDHVLSVYDSSSKTVYRLPLGQKHEQGASGTSMRSTGLKVPATAAIQQALSLVAGQVNLGGAVPAAIGGRPAYSLRISPKHDVGLLGSAELAWDSANGVPLRAALYAAGNASPVLELEATEMHYGPVKASDLNVTPPADAKVVTVPTNTGAAPAEGSGGRDVQGLAAVQAAVPFTLTAPNTLVGLPRKSVRLIEVGDTKGALVLYGQGLGAIAVVETPVKQAETATSKKEKLPQPWGAAALPRVSVNGTPGTELSTALGTVLNLRRGGVTYTLVGSLPAAAAVSAARELLP